MYYESPVTLRPSEKHVYVCIQYVLFPTTTRLTNAHSRILSTTWYTEVSKWNRFLREYAK